MEHRRGFVTAIAVTIILSLIVAGVTEEVRQYMQFTWEIEEGEQFIFEVSVFGYSKRDSVFLPLPERILNNSRILVTIVSLPEIPSFINSELFSENIIEYVKTRTTYENGNLILITIYRETNTLASRCFIPKGSWSFLDSLFPNNTEQKENTTIESYIAVQLQDSFYLGYNSYRENQASGWFGIISKETGVPQIATFWAYGIDDNLEYSYNMTLTLAT